MSRTIGVISDTHIPHFKQLPQAVWQHFAGVELIIHAGDLSVLSVIRDLETIAPVVAVQGNIAGFLNYTCTGLVTVPFFCGFASVLTGSIAGDWPAPLAV